MRARASRSGGSGKIAMTSRRRADRWAQPVGARRAPAQSRVVRAVDASRSPEPPRPRFRLRRRRGRRRGRGRWFRRVEPQLGARPRHVRGGGQEIRRERPRLRQHVVRPVHVHPDPEPQHPDHRGAPPAARHPERSRPRATPPLTTNAAADTITNVRCRLQCKTRLDEPALFDELRRPTPRAIFVDDVSRDWFIIIEHILRPAFLSASLPSRATLHPHPPSRARPARDAPPPRPPTVPTLPSRRRRRPRRYHPPGWIR